MGIQKINSIYFVNETVNPKHSDKLYLNQRHKFSSDEFLQEWILQILKHLFEQYIHSNELYNDEKKVYNQIVPTRDRNNNENSTRLIKRMNSSKSVYEARGFSGGNEHPRMLFFLLDDNNFSEELALGSVIFTFYFLKVENMGKYDPTQRLIEETDDIKEFFFMTSFNTEIIGYELLKER